jgi:hypothetical protein
MSRKSKLKPLGIKAQEKLLALLREAADHAEMSHADFGSFWVRSSQPLPFPKDDKQVTPFIKERTKTYRESWIIRPLKNAINVIESNGEFKD